MGNIGGGSWSARVGADPFDAAGSSSPTLLTEREVYTDRGSTLLGLRAGQLAALWEEIEASTNGASITGWQTTRTGSGGSTAQAAVSGGIISLSTGATANSTEEHFSQDSAVAAVRTTKWYMATRFRLPSAVDAQAKLGAGLRSGAATVAVGFFGSIDAVNFRAQFDGNFDTSGVDLGVAKDGAFHVFEMWCIGDSVLRCRIDGGPTLTGNMAANVNNAYRIVTARNGTTAASRTNDFDWMLVLTQREP